VSQYDDKSKDHVERAVQRLSGRAPSEAKLNGTEVVVAEAE